MDLMGRSSPGQVEAQEAIQMAQQALRGSAGKRGEGSTPPSRKGRPKRDYKAAAKLSYEDEEERRLKAI